MLARSLRRTVSESRRPHSAVLSSALAPKPRAAWGWQEALLGLADRLERPGPMNPCGVARAKLLLTDRASPLDNRSASEPLLDAIWSVADGLRLCPPHEWDSPQVMKLGPEHVAWTCRRCGAVATSDDVAVRRA
jgi:hypothetical protein